MANFPIAAKTDIAVVKQGVRIAAKNAGMLGDKNQIVLVLDVSGSMEFAHNGFYHHGIIDGIVRRALGMALVMDDDGKVPVYALDGGVHRLPVLDQSNLDTYVEKHVRKLVGGGTRYAPTIKAVIDDLPGGDASLVIFVTDGDNDDHAEAERAMRDASQYPAFFQFLGVHGASQPATFRFLHQLDDLSGRVVDNAGFSVVPLHSVTEDGPPAARV